jgi:phytoene dehydrogenase-like protein
MDVLGELGVEVQGRVPSVSGAFAVKGGVKHTFPAGMVSLLTTSLFNLSAKLETARLLASLAKIDGNKVMNMSVREWVDAEISHAGVKDFLMAVFRVSTYANAPELMSAGAALEQLKLAFGKSVLYLDGGWQTLVDKLADAAKRAGVHIETNAKVESVERDLTGAVRGVRFANGRAIIASTVVIASSPAAAVNLVERGHQTQLARWADEAIPVKAATLDIALRYLPKPKATFALGVDRPLYLSVHSATARLAPEGGALIHVAKYLAPEGEDSNDAIERELEGLLDLVQPGWRAALGFRRFLPDLIVANALPLADCSGTRPGPQVDDVPGLFVVGDWVGKDGMLVDTSLASARKAAKMIVEPKPAALAVAG